MRPGQQQNKRMRGRGRKGPNNLSRSFESNGPDVKIRGTAQHIAEKYAALARDASSAGDRVMAENYLQHAEHYGRIVAAAQGSFQPAQQEREYDDGDEDGEDGSDFAPNNQPQGGNYDRGQQQNDRDRGQFDRNRDDRNRDRDFRGERNNRGDMRNDRPHQDRGNQPHQARNEGVDADGQPRADNAPRHEGHRDRPRRERGEWQPRGDRQDRGERRFEDRPRPEGFEAARTDETRETIAPAAADHAVTAVDTAPVQGSESDGPRRRQRGRRERPNFEDMQASAPVSPDLAQPAPVPAPPASDVAAEPAVPAARRRAPKPAVAETEAAPQGEAEAPAKRKPGRPRKKAAEDEGGDSESALPAFLLASNG